MAAGFAAGMVAPGLTIAEREAAGHPAEGTADTALRMRRWAAGGSDTAAMPFPISRPDMRAAFRGPGDAVAPAWKPSAEADDVVARPVGTRLEDGAAAMPSGIRVAGLAGSAPPPVFRLGAAAAPLRAQQGPWQRPNATAEALPLPPADPASRIGASRAAPIQAVPAIPSAGALSRPGAVPDASSMASFTFDPAVISLVVHGSATALATGAAALDAAGFDLLQAAMPGIAATRSVVRYFHDGDRGAAQAAAAVLDAPVEDMSAFRPVPPQGRVEVWLAGP